MAAISSATSKIMDEYSFFIIDALTYAGPYINIADIIENKGQNFDFQKLDIRNSEAITRLFKEREFFGVINFAAESHVDRSIDNPNIFLETNVLGTLNLLKASLDLYKRTNNEDLRFVQISTDEVYGSLKPGEPGFTEKHNLLPNSPYSASKASADLLVRSFFKTYGLPVINTRCSNNYGPRQFPEKLIPLMIHNAKNDIPLPVYGDGKNVRDWIHVDDHNEGVWQAFQKGTPGEIYNFGGNCEYSNILVVEKILEATDKGKNLITFVKDRLGHDFRYAIDHSKAQSELGWEPSIKFEEGLKKTVQWYNENSDWIAEVTK